VYIVMWSWADLSNRARDVLGPTVRVTSGVAMATISKRSEAKLR
jgi:hypothetical protein